MEVPPQRGEANCLNQNRLGLFQLVRENFGIMYSAPLFLHPFGRILF